MKFRKYILAVILVLSATVRLYKLATVPPHLTPDEAALGYNAYSILKTGKDEYGKLLPFMFKSFGDYKPGLYVYTAVPSIAVFGLNEFGVRFPSAMFGVLSVLVIYLLVKELKIGDWKLGILASLMLAISPWHIQFSRGAWEINLSLTLMLCGIYFFYKAIKKQKFILLSAFFFGLSLLSYQGAKLSSGIVILILVLLYLKNLTGMNKKILFLSALLGVLISLPILLGLLSGKAGRLEVFSVFSYMEKGDYLGVAKSVIEKWFNHFSGKFLFFDGDWQNPRHTSPYSGVLLMSDMAFLPLGIYSMIKKGGKNLRLVWLWVVFAALPALLTRDSVHAVRAYTMVIPLTVISAFGLGFLVEGVGKHKAGRRIFAAVLIVISLLYYLDSYFVHLPIHNAKYWFYGYRQAVDYIGLHKEYDNVYFQQSYDQPYIYYLFFTDYPPTDYQKQAKFVIGDNKLDVGKIENIDNIHFKELNWPGDFEPKNSLYIVNPEKILTNFWEGRNDIELKNRILYPNGESAFLVLATKE